MKNNFWTKLYGFLYMKVARYWWVFWSNIRFKKAIRHNVPIHLEDTVSDLAGARTLVKKLYKKFTWTADGIDQLGDAITPPPQNYQHYLEGELKDDCDGFHSLVYHCLYNSGFTCYLLSVIALGGSHCVLLFKSKNNKWYVNDYTRIYDGCDTPIDAINDYNKIFVTRYTVKSNVVANDVIIYDYNKKKLKLKNIKDL